MNEYLFFAKELADKAGVIMREHFDSNVETEIKGDSTPVTIADTAINKMVIDAVAERYPDHDVLGEEASSGEITAEYVWVCDPIDGTIPYTMSIPVSMFSLALVRNGKPIVAVLYDPAAGKLYEATAEAKTKINDKPARLNNQSTLKGSYIAIPAIRYGMLDNLKVIDDFIDDKSTRSMSLFCITAEACLVLNGKIAATIFPGDTAWDIAAIQLIVTQAGGKVTDLHGNDQRYDRPINGAIVSNGFIHDELVKLVRPHIL